MPRLWKSMMQAQQLKIRLPSDLKAFIDAQAERNGSSLNSEVVRAIRERLDRQALKQTST